MSGYLLLRDNKQTGPYSCEELIAKGFKAYDLIWAEGKSAGWRYPSEFPEFAKFAPVIEEQPFDRFFKKPTTSKPSNQNTEKQNSYYTNEPSISEVKSSSEIEKEVPKIESRPARLVALENKKVFVTMPSTGQVNRSHVEIKPRPVDNNPVKEELPEGIVAAKPIVVEDKIESTPKQEKVETKENHWAKYNFQSTPQPKTEEHTKEKFVQEKIAEPILTDKWKSQVVSKQANEKSRRLITAAVAACLLLGGIVIGLAISNAKQSAQQELLNKLVNKRIEDNKNAVGNSASKATLLPANQQAPTDQSAPATLVENKTEEINKELVKPTVQTENTTQTEAIRTIKKEPGKQEESNVVPEGKAAEPVKKDDPAVETAKKNIYNLITIEGNKYKVGVLGGISNLEITLSNNSLYPLDQVEVIVNYHGPENRIVRKETVLISDIAAGTQKIVPVQKSKRGVSVSYTINKINSKALGIAHLGL